MGNEPNKPTRFQEAKEQEADAVRIVADAHDCISDDIDPAETLIEGTRDYAGADVDLTGKIIGNHYEVISKIGEGSAGVVYKARHLHLDRIVALKVLSPELRMDSKALMRFRQEAQALTSLQHRNIVRTYDFGISEDGSPYLTMEFVEGETLADVLGREGRLPVEKAIEIITQAGAGLIHAHANGVIHRDIKPENIVLSGGADRTVKILDFGIAKVTQEHGQRLTETGRIFGSPLYMSPEQCHGKQLDARSDLYSLACVLYELLSGAPPYRGESVVATLIQHIQSPVPDISQELVAEPVNECLHKALAKDADKRYATIEQFLNALKSATQEPGAPANDWNDPRFWRALDGKIESYVDSSAIRQRSKVLLPRLAIYSLLGVMVLIVAVYLFVKTTITDARTSVYTDASAWSAYYEAGKRSLALGDHVRAEKNLLDAEANAQFTGQKRERILALQELQKLYEGKGLSKEAKRLAERISKLQESLKD